MLKKLRSQNQTAKAKRAATVAMQVEMKVPKQWMESSESIAS